MEIPQEIIDKHNALSEKAHNLSKLSKEEQEAFFAQFPYQTEITWDCLTGAIISNTSSL